MADAVKCSESRFNEIKRELKRKIKKSNTRIKTLTQRRLEKSLHSSGDISLDETIKKQRILLALNKSLADNVQRCRVENRNLTNRLTEAEILVCEVKLDNGCLKEQQKQLEDELKVEKERSAKFEKLISLFKSLIDATFENRVQPMTLGDSEASKLAILLNGGAQLNKENIDEINAEQKNEDEHFNNFSYPAESNFRAIFNMSSITEEGLITPNTSVVDGNTTILSNLGDDAEEKMEESGPNDALLIESDDSAHHSQVMEGIETSSRNELVVFLNTERENCVGNVERKDDHSKSFKEVKEDDGILVESRDSSKRTTFERTQLQIDEDEMFKENALQQTDCTAQIDLTDDKDQICRWSEMAEKISVTHRKSSASSRKRSKSKASQEFEFSSAFRNRTKSTTINNAIDTTNNIVNKRSLVSEIGTDSGEESDKVEVKDTFEVAEPNHEEQADEIIEDSVESESRRMTFTVLNSKDKRMTYTVVKSSTDNKASISPKNDIFCKPVTEITELMQPLEVKTKEISKALRNPGNIGSKIARNVQLLKKGVLWTQKSNESSNSSVSKVNVNTTEILPTPRLVNNVLDSTNLNVEEMEFTVCLNVPIIVHKAHENQPGEQSTSTEITNIPILNSSQSANDDHNIESVAPLTLNEANIGSIILRSSVNDNHQNEQSSDTYEVKETLNAPSKDLSVTVEVTRVSEVVNDKISRNGANKKRGKSESNRCSKRMKLLTNIFKDDNQLSKDADLEKGHAGGEKKADFRSSNTVDKENVFDSEISAKIEAGRSRRQRNAVNYAEPNLIRKVRRP